jgi:hypothetical protein
VVGLINYFSFKALIFWEKVKGLLGFENYPVINCCIVALKEKNQRSVQIKGSNYNETFIFVTKKSRFKIKSKAMISSFLPTTLPKCYVIVIFALVQMETFPISDSESEGATSAAAAQVARTPALKRPLSDEGEVDCITLDSDSEEEQVGKNWPRSIHLCLQQSNPARETVTLRNQLWFRQYISADVLFPPILLGQRVTKRCRLSLLTISALVYEPKCGGGGLRGLSQ